MDKNAGSAKKVILMISQVVLGACFMVLTTATFEQLSRGNTNDATLKGIAAAAMAVMLIVSILMSRKNVLANAEGNNLEANKITSGVITIGITAVYALFLFTRIKSPLSSQYLLLSGSNRFDGESIPLSDVTFFFLWLAASGGIYLGVYLIQKARQGKVSK